jgi:hypothetical protein
MSRWLTLLLCVVAAPMQACGEEPTPLLRISGRVISTANSAGIANARLELWFTAFAQPTRMLEATTTDSNGVFALEIGPPPGYRAPNCATLHLEVSAAGYGPNPLVGVGAVDSPQCRAGAVVLTIALTPTP